MTRLDGKRRKAPTKKRAAVFWRITAESSGHRSTIHKVENVPIEPKCNGTIHTAYIPPEFRSGSDSASSHDQLLRLRHFVHGSILQLRDMFSEIVET